MTFVISLTGELVDEVTHARQGPYVGDMTMLCCALPQCIQHCLALCGSQSWLASGRAFTTQRFVAALDPGLLPLVSGLTFDPEQAGDLGSSQTALEIGHGLEPALFHFLVVPLLVHVSQTLR